MQILPPAFCRSFEGWYNQYNKTLGHCIPKFLQLNDETIMDHVLCAKYPEKGAGTCQGDSGGPLTVKRNGRHFLVGITSAGYGCAVSFFPDPSTFSCLLCENI